MLGAADERALIQHYKGACTMVVGEEDYATPVSMAQELARLLPQADLHVLQNVRHYSPIQAPELIAPLLKNLFAKA
jgi:3-oxoadipate enol-lactonase